MLKRGICPEIEPFSTLPYNWFFIFMRKVFLVLNASSNRISYKFLSDFSLPPLQKKRSVRSPRAIQFSPHPCGHVEVVGAPRCEKKHRRCCRLPQKSMMG